MTDLEAEDAQTIHPPSRQPGCRCPDPGRACGCDDDGTTAEPREWIHAEKPETTCHGRGRDTHADPEKTDTPRGGV